jgi:tryptophan-rich sensory protein
MNSVGRDITASDIEKPSAVVTWLALVGWILLSFSAAALGGLAGPGEWYRLLNKPSWNPPNWIFGPVWTALYTAMGVAAWLVWRRGGWSTQRPALMTFLIQLALNALWSPLFFGLRAPGLAFAEIIFLWFAILATLVLFWRRHTVAGVLFVPYLAWVSFAAVLNFVLWRMNP